MDGMTPEIGDYVEVLIDGKSKSGGNIRARTPKGDIQIPDGQEGDVVVVEILNDHPPFQAKITEPPENETVHSLVEYHRNLKNPGDPETPDRREKWIRSRNGDRHGSEAVNPHRMNRTESKEEEEDDEADEESPFSDDVVGSKNDLL